MLYKHRCSPDTPETLFAEFTRGERKGERYHFTYALPDTVAPNTPPRLDLTFTCFETDRVYTCRLELITETLNPTGPEQHQITVYNFFRSVTKNLKANDWRVLASYYEKLAPECIATEDLITDADITFDFAHTANDNLVSYVELSAAAGSTALGLEEDYLVILQDQYCTNMDCRCEQSQVAVLLTSKQRDAQKVEPQKVASISVSWSDGQESTINKYSPDPTLKKIIPSKKELLRLVDTQALRAKFQARYQQIRQAKAAYLKQQGFKSETEFRAHHASQAQQSPANRPTQALTQTLTQSPTRSRASMHTPSSHGNVASLSAAADKKAGRNDPCPCGSARKYKKCCGR